MATQVYEGTLVVIENSRVLTTRSRFRYQFILHIQDEKSDDVTEIAFLDARRLGRIRLCASPLTEPPISTLGFDPILSMPDLKYFKQGVLKRRCPIKALLLDQSFSAGVGNWVAGQSPDHSRRLTTLKYRGAKMRSCIMPESTRSVQRTVLPTQSFRHCMIRLSLSARPLFRSMQTTLNSPKIGFSNIDGYASFLLELFSHSERST